MEYAGYRKRLFWRSGWGRVVRGKVRGANILLQGVIQADYTDITDELIIVRSHRRCFECYKDLWKRAPGGAVSSQSASRSP